MRQRHEIYTRRRSRNVGVGIVLVALVAVIFAVTLVKMENGHMMEGFDHQVRPSLLPEVESQ
jgi:hypothetical protein